MGSRQVGVEGKYRGRGRGGGGEERGKECVVGI